MGSRGNSPQKRAYAKSLAQIHIAVFFLGLSALAGKWSGQSALVLTFARVWISAPALLIYLALRRMPLRLHARRDYGAMALLGALWAAHWVAFLQSAQIATVAIATITFATYPVFVTFLEPWLFKERLRLSAVLQAFLMLAGAAVIVPWAPGGAGLLPGFLIGMAASFLHAAIVLINRRMVADYPGELVAFYSQASAALLLLPAGLILRPVFAPIDWAAALVLGLLCSALAQALLGCGLKRVKAQTMALIGGLESVYGILLAALLLGQPPTPRELLGGAVVLGVSLYATLKKQNAAALEKQA